MNATDRSLERPADDQTSILRAAAVSALEALADGDLRYAEAILLSALEGGDGCAPGRASAPAAVLLPRMPNREVAAQVARRAAERYAAVVEERLAA